MTAELLLPIDVETTGLDATEDSVLEVGWQILADDYSPLPGMRDRVQSHVISVSQAVIDRIHRNPFIEDMHQRSGLLADLMKFTSEDPGNPYSIGSVDLYIATAMRAAAQKFHPGEDVIFTLVGRSVGFDATFIANHMPQVQSLINHQVDNISSIISFFKKRAKVEMPEIPPVGVAHRAGDDISGDIALIRAYRDHARAWMPPLVPVA